MDSQEYFVNQPDIIMPPAPPEPNHPRRADRAAATGHPDQRGVLDAVQYALLDRVVLGALLQRLAVLDADEGAGNDDVAREEYPGAEGCEEVVRAGDFVEAQEHVDVLRLGG